MWRLWFAIVFILLAVGSCNVKYKAIKKYYPGLTFVDYLIIGDKLRITPNGE